jgi:hypothetical protein
MNRSAVWFGAALALVALLGGSRPVYAGSMAVPADESPVALGKVVTGKLEKPLFLTPAGDGSARLYVLEQPGRIRLLEQGVLAAGSTGSSRRDELLTLFLPASTPLFPPLLLPLRLCVARPSLWEGSRIL